MKNNLTCELVEDLMPSYIDGLTSEVTNKAVREHLADCNKCKAKLDNMKEPCSEEKIEAEKKEIDFLKKARKRNLKVIISSVISVVLIISVVVCTFPFMIRYTADDSMIDYNVTVDGGKINIKVAAIRQSNAKITDILYDISDNGIMDISFEFRRKSVFDQSEILNLDLTANVRSIVCQGKFIWEDGEYISPVTSAVYKYRTPYIGDMSHNQKIASALGVYEYFGSFTNALYTKAEPYGWKIIITDPVMPVTEKASRQLMKQYSYVLLGVIGNLSFVTFSYDLFNSSGEDEEKSLTITKEQASEFFGEDIKKCSEDINNLQRLMDKTGLSEMPYIDAENTENFEAEINDQVRIYLFNASDAIIKRIELYCRETETMGAVGYADDWSLNIGGRPTVTKADMDVWLDHLSGNAYDKSRLGTVTVDVTVYDWEDNAYKLEDTIEVSAFFATVYKYKLTGDFEKGFSLKQ